MRVALHDRLVNLARAGSLHPHQPDAEELEQHLSIADQLIADAKKEDNSLATRFSVANSAGHALLMAVIKMAGYRPSTGKGHRVVLYQILDELVPGAADAKETLLRCHNTRNKTEYEGDSADFTEGQVEDLIDAVENVREEIGYLFGKYSAKAAKP